MKIALYCKCGASAVGMIKPKENAQQFIERFRQLHNGKHCSPCDQKTAANARRREDRKANA